MEERAAGRRQPGVRDDRGITLTELTIVMALAAIVMVGLMTFYLNSQGVWLDGSAQALTQRDATLVIERITRQTRGASLAYVADDPDSLHQLLALFDASGSETGRIFWSVDDSTVHSGSVGNPDEGPIAGSKVDRLQFDSDGKVVTVRRLSMRSGTGEPVEMASSVALYNKP